MQWSHEHANALMPSELLCPKLKNLRMQWAANAKDFLTSKNNKSGDIYNCKRARLAIYELVTFISDQMYQ